MRWFRQATVPRVQTGMIILAASAALASDPQVIIGEIIGTEYNTHKNEFVVYASEAGPHDGTVLYVDDIVKLALAVFTSGDFAFSLEQGKTNMRIAYLPAEVRVPRAAGGQVIDAEARRETERLAKELESILRGSRVEATFLQADRVMKDLAHGRKVADGIDIGASEFFLCLKEIEEWTSKKPLEKYPKDPYVTYYQLSVDYAFDEFQEMGIWFGNARIIVMAGTRGEGKEAPKCVAAFTRNLTDNMYQLLAHKQLGPEFRRLKALLVLCKVLGWAKSVFVPVDTGLLRSCPSIPAHHAAVPIRELPIAARDADGKSVARLNVRGGILAGEGVFPPPTSHPAWSEAPGSQQGVGPGGQVSPGFIVSSGVWYGRKLLRIDLSGILGLKKEVGL